MSRHERSRWMAEDWRDHPVWAPGSIHSVEALPMEAYHAGPGVSKSMLDKARRSIAYMLNPPPREGKSYLDLGSAVNDAVLLPELFAERYVCGPENRRGNAWKDARQEAADAGKVLLIEADYDFAAKWGEAVHRHPIAAGMLADALHREATVVWEDEETGLLCRCRPDVVTHAWTVCDLKTAFAADWESFRSAIFTRRYHVSAAMSCAALERITGGAPGYVFMVIDKELPPAPENLVLYQLDDSFRIRGAEELREDLRRVAQWVKSSQENEDAWTGYPLGLVTVPLHRGGTTHE